VEGTSDLTTWAGVASPFNTNGALHFHDPAAATGRVRFYRAQLAPPDG
jgi:hypothetical protein